MGKHYKKADREQMKKQFLVYFEESRGMIETSAERIGVSQQTIHNWMNSDPDFKSKVNAIQEKQHEFVVGKLMNLIENNNTSAIIFYCKTRLGWSETTKVALEQTGTIDVEATLRQMKEELTSNGNDD